MSLPHSSDIVPEQTVRVARRALPKGNKYLTLRDHLGTIFNDAMFAHRLCQLILGEVALSYNGMASSCVFMDFSSYGERQLGPEAKAAGQVATAQLCWRTGSSVTEQIRDLGMGKEKALSA